MDAYESTDLRFQTWFTDQEDVLFQGYLYTGIPVFAKYFGNPELNNSIVPNARQHVKPFMIGEMYLILAEASLQAGDSQTAQAALNELQAKRGATPTAATMENIQDEWFKETIGEGLYFSCMKRWHKGYEGRPAAAAVAGVGYVREGIDNTQKSMPADDDHWLLPIPTYERQLNDNLVQNPGY